MTITVKGFELGGYQGIPSEAYNDIELRAAPALHFNHTFGVVKIID